MTDYTDDTEQCNDNPRLFTVAEVEDIVRRTVRPMVLYIERLEDRLKDHISDQTEIIKLQSRLDRLEANPDIAKPRVLPVNERGIPPCEDILKITAQVWDNGVLTSQQRRQHMTRYQIKLECLTTDNRMYRTKVETYTPEQFFKHKAKAAVGISPEVQHFLTHQDSGWHMIGMVLDKTRRGGSCWMQEQVLAFYFDRDRPVVNLLLNGTRIEFRDFKTGYDTKGASDWIAVWHREAH